MFLLFNLIISFVKKINRYDFFSSIRGFSDFCSFVAIPVFVRVLVHVRTQNIIPVE